MLAVVYALQLVLETLELPSVLRTVILEMGRIDNALKEHLESHEPEMVVQVVNERGSLAMGTVNKDKIPNLQGYQPSTLALPVSSRPQAFQSSGTGSQPEGDAGHQLSIMRTTPTAEHLHDVPGVWTPNMMVANVDAYTDRVRAEMEHQTG